MVLRKLFISLLLLLSAFLLFAGGEREDVMKLTWVAGGKPHAFPEGVDPQGFPGVQEKVAADFENAHPGVKVTVLYRDVTQGSLTVDAMMARGEPPDVWLDAQGYFLKYMNDDYALRLDEYVDTSIYYDYMVEPFTKNGHVYALPQNNVAGGFAINLDMLKLIGYDMPEQPDWTTDEFTRLSKRLQAVGIPSTMISTMDGMHSWLWPWIYAFGGALFENQNHSKVTINTPEAIKGFEYMKMLVDEGYAYPYPNEQSQDTAVELFTTGRVFSSMMQNGHVNYWLPQQVAQGVIEKEFEVTFVEAPHEPGREHTPTFGYFTVAVAHKSDNEERNKMVAALAYETAVGKEYMYALCTVGGGFPTIKGFAPADGNAAKPMYKAIDQVRRNAGLMDLGALSPLSEELDRPWKPLVQAFIAGEISVQDMLNQYEAEAKQILAK